MGAPHVTCCPLSDGYDLLFQIDYKKAWNAMVETIGEASDYLPEIPLFVEPKYSETRVHCQLDSTAKALLLDNLGFKKSWLEKPIFCIFGKKSCILCYSKGYTKYTRHLALQSVSGTRKINSILSKLYSN